MQLSTVKAADAGKPAVLGLMLQEAQEPEEAPMVQMLGALPKDMQQALEQSLRQAMEGGIPSAMRTLMGEDQSQNTLQRLTVLREQLEKQEQEQKTPIDIRYYHCDHLGTPLALTDSQRQIVWAARLDPWGNVEEEFNPHQIEQSIRLPGQHHDRDTGLYYNRHRYYDPSLGSYINQDPIGLRGGVNSFVYPINPTVEYDPLGLQKVSRTSTRTGTRQPALFDHKVPQRELDKQTAGAISKNQDQHSIWDNINDAINPKNQGRKRMDEALVCLEQTNKETGEVLNYEDYYYNGEPSLTPLDRPFPPSPNSLDPGWVCTKEAFRRGFNGGPPPGL